jgi:hypothetical protein
VKEDPSDKKGTWREVSIPKNKADPSEILAHGGTLIRSDVDVVSDETVVFDASAPIAALTETTNSLRADLNQLRLEHTALMAKVAEQSAHIKLLHAKIAIDESSKEKEKAA